MFIQQFDSYAGQLCSLIIFVFVAGPVLIVNVNRNLLQDNLAKRHTFTDLHKFKTAAAPCTALAVFESDIATVGEDGTWVHTVDTSVFAIFCFVSTTNQGDAFVFFLFRLNVLSSDGRVLKQFLNYDSCSMTSVSFVNHKEVQRQRYFIQISPFFNAFVIVLF